MGVMTPEHTIRVLAEGVEESGRPEIEAGP